ncbi:uncharacterized protein GBIM_10069 [Gryllus bimaculatus]|nr:uncharacterized protein GBIM_10069 [Gryllus bimaculatus]
MVYLPDYGGTIDILRLLNLSARTPGVAQVPGPILNVPAFKLRPGFGLVQVPNPSAVTSALSSSAGFTLVFVYRQHRKSLAGGLGWTFVHLSLNSSTNMLRLQLDCQPAREQPVAGSGGRGGARALPGGLVPHMHVPDDALVYFRQEPGFKKKFLGSMQVAKVYPYATTQHSDWTCDGYRLVRQTQ